jgi:hypothetical protein
VGSITRKKPAFLELGANLLAALQEGNLTVLSTSEDFQTVTDGVLKAKETKSASLSHRLGDGLFKLVPLAGIALGVTGFAADVRGPASKAIAILTGRHRASHHLDSSLQV